MIVWLASYPRSGNTLLRTVLKRCLGLDSYADEPIHVESPVRSDNTLVGHLELPAPWDDFHAQAKAAPGRVFVKTHLPPRDDAPFIYVVRDGRLAVKSYEKYYEHYLPGHPVNLFRLIAGDDAYGDWTAHYRAWNERAGQGLIVRFEELVDIGPQLLARIAQFLGHEGEIVPWRNPLDQLARAEPGLFRGGGSRQFDKDADWSPLVDAYFNYFHGELMARLGYGSADVSQPPPDQRALFEWSRELVRRNTELMGTCDERLALIHRLHDEAQRRLDIINSMHEKTGT